MSLFPSPAELERARSIAFRGLVRFHASELLESHHFRRRGRISTGQVRAIAKDLDKLDRVHPLDVVIEDVLAAADALELEREAKASSELPSLLQRQAE